MAKPVKKTTTEEPKVTAIKTKTAVPTIAFITTDAQARSALRAVELKKEIAEFATQCDALIIETVEDEQIAMNMFTQLNDVVKRVQKEGKTLRDPYTKGNKAIIAVENEIVGEAEEVVNNGRKKLVASRQKRAEIERKKLEEQEKEVELQRQQNESVHKTFEDQIKTINGYEIEVLTKLNNCGNMDQLREQFEGYVHSEKWAGKGGNAWKDFIDDGEKMRVRLVTFKDVKKAFLQAPSNPSTVIEINNYYIAAIELANEYYNKLQLSIQKSAVNEDDNLAAAQQGIVTRMSSPVANKGARFIWTFEVVDKTSIPSNWLILDTDRAKEFLASNKETMEDPTVYNGIKFYKKETVAL